MPPDDRIRLKDILVRRSLSTSGSFTLHSGEKSTVYVDGKLTTMVPEAMPLVGRSFLQKMRELGWTPEAVGWTDARRRSHCLCDRARKP